MAARHLRKKDISDYYKGRSDILLDDAEKLFCHPQVLGSIDGKFNDVGCFFIPLNRCFV